MREWALGVLIRIAGQILLEVLVKTFKLTQEILDDPSKIESAEKRIELFNSLKKQCPKYNEKVLEFAVSLIEELVKQGISQIGIAK